MSTIGEMLAVLGINTAPFTAGLNKANAEMTGFAAKAETTSKAASGSMNMAGMAMAGVAVGAIALGAESARAASTFQASMALIQTQAGGTAAEVRDMTSAVLALAPTVGVGPDQLAAGLYHVESAGLRGAQALEILRIAAEGAKVGHADLESVTNALIAAQQSGVGGVTSMSAAMGTLNAIVGSGNMRMQDLADAMGTGVLSTAKNYGVTIQSVGAALASMTDQGIPAIDAATRLNSAMRLMAAPTSKAVTELKSIGLSSVQLATDMRSPGGMLTAITDLKTHLDRSGLSAVQQAALIAHAFGGKQSGAILTLIGNVDLLRQKTEAVAKGAGTFGAAWAATQATTAEQGAEVAASMQTLNDSIGLGLLPTVNGLLHAVLPVVQALATWAAQNQGLASQILLIVGGVAALGAGLVFLGPILGAIGGVIGVITSPILLVIGAITALAAHFGLLGKDAKAFADGILGTIAGAIPGVVSMLTNLAAQFVAWIGPMIPKAIAALGGLASQAIAWIAAQGPVFLAQLLAWADAFVGWIAPMIPQALAALGAFGVSLVQWVLDEIPILAAGIAMMAGELVNWVLPKIPGLLADLAQFGIALIGWIAGEAVVVGGAMVTLAGSAVGALGDALIKDPTLIVKGIGLLLAGVAVVAAAQAAATVVGAAYTWAMKLAATAAGAIADFAQGIASAILTKLTTMAAAGGVVGTAIGAAMTVGALAAEGFGNIGAAIVGVIGGATPAVTAAAAAQGTTAGAAGAVSFGAALATGMTAAAVVAVAAAWAIINDGLNKQVAAVGSRLSSVMGAQTLAQLEQDKAAITQGIKDIAGQPFAGLLYGDQLKALMAQLDQVNAQIATVKTAAAAAPFAHDSRLPVGPPHLVAIPEAAGPKLVAVAEGTGTSAAQPLTAAQSAAAQAAATSAATQAAVTKAAGSAGAGPSASALASAPVSAATAAAAQATAAAQIHLESLRVQLQTAELAANAGDAAAVQQVLVLKAEIAHQQAADAVAAAQRAVTVAEAAVKASHDKLVLAQAGKIKGLNIVAVSEAAYKLAQDKLTLATERLTLAQGSAALQAQTSVQTAADAVAKANNAVAAAQIAVAMDTQRLADAQAGRIKGVNAVVNAEAALAKAQERLTAANTTLATAQEKLTAAQSATGAAAAASGVVTAAAPALIVAGGLVEPAGGITGAGGALGITSGATTGGTAGAATATGAPSSGTASYTAALVAFTAMLAKAIASGIPITLDGQTIGDMVDRHAYLSASAATSGFVAQGSIG